MSTMQSDPNASVEQVLDAGSAKQIVGRSPWQLFWRRFRQDRFAFFGLGVIVLLTVLAIAAPLISSLVGHGPNEQFASGKDAMTDSYGLPLGPNKEFWFGADGRLGRDLFVRIIYGIRTTLTVALLATGVSVLIGVTMGILAGYFRGAMDTIISRLIDIILSMPILLFAIGIVAACSTTKQGCLGGLLKPGMPVVIAVIAFFSWPYIARIVRGSTLSLREKEFVEASRSLGASNRRIMFKEILPNLMAPILVYATLIIPANILFEAYLSFLGLGLPAKVASWGRMLSDAAQFYDVAWWTMVYPGFFLFLTTLAFNLLGDGLRDALDPRTGRG